MKQTIAEKIYKYIGEVKITTSPITPDSHFYLDLNFDSLGYVSLLLNLEERFSIKFELSEMTQCLKVQNLIFIITKKLKERNEIC